MVKFKSKTRVRLTQDVDRHTTDGSSRYLPTGTLGTVRSYKHTGEKRTYGVEFDPVRDDPWNAGLHVVVISIELDDGSHPPVLDFCEAVNEDDAMGMPGSQWRGFIGANDTPRQRP